MKKELSEEELKMIELDILKYIHSFCEKNNIRYYLCGGTLLGAIRHGGFIPWDDDIDICMPRSDYERFKREFINQGKYKFIYIDNTREYALPFGKVINSDTLVEENEVRSVNDMGVFVDVFPLDGLGNTLNEAKKNVRKCNTIFKWILLGIRKNEEKRNIHSFFKNGIYHLARSTKKDSYRKILRIGQKNKFEDSAFVGVIFGFYAEKEIMPSGIFMKQTKHVFEDAEFCIPIKYDEYLSRLYGDYMRIPPLDKQITHHSFRAYIKE